MLYVLCQVSALLDGVNRVPSYTAVETVFVAGGTLCQALPTQENLHSRELSASTPMGLQEVSSGFLRLWVVCIDRNVRQTQSTIQKSYIHEFSPDHASFQSIRMLSSSSSLLTACCSCSKSSNLSTIYKIKDIVLSLFLPLDAMSCLMLTTLAFSSSFNWLVILLFSSLILA